MTYELIEASVFDGRPARLYQFRRNDEIWAYCTGDTPIDYDGVVFQPLQISDRGHVDRTGNDDVLFNVTLPAVTPVAQLYRGMPPTMEIFITVIDVHLTDIDPVGVVAWTGSISGCKWPALDRAELICTTEQQALKNNGLRITWNRGCSYALYGRGCGLNREDFAQPASVQVVSGNTLQVAQASDFIDGYFAGGFLTILLPQNVIDTRTIQSHVGSELVLFSSTQGIANNAAVTLYPGCQRTIKACQQFGNEKNYPGAPGMPGRSPFDGNPVF